MLERNEWHYAPQAFECCDTKRRSPHVPSQHSKHRIELMTPLRSFDDSLLLFPNSRTDQSIAPVFSLARRGDLLFFVNHSDHVLDYVSSEASGALATGDGDVTFADGGRYHYPDVRPREAVLLDEYDMVLDSDFYIALEVHLASAALGQWSFSTTNKGGTGSIVLLWEDGFVSPRIKATHTESAS